MAKMWILITRTTDPNGVNESGRLVYSQADLKQRVKDAEARGAKTSVRKVK